MSRPKPEQIEIDVLFNKLHLDSKNGGYNLNADSEFSKALTEGLIINEKRYGYQACPCRLASGLYEEDRDIICPCIYRDQDISEFGACYCGLYVSDEIADGKKKLKSIPDRHRPKSSADATQQQKTLTSKNLKYPVWRCTVCGYICARENPPEKCPICKVTKDRFEKFLDNI